MMIVMKIKGLLQNKIFSCFAAIFCTVLWGTAFPFIKLGYSSFEIAEGDIGSKLLFAGLRFALAGLMVLVLLCVSNRRFMLPDKGEALPVVTLGLVMTAGQYIFTYVGIGFTSGTNTSIITACASFFTVLAAPIFFKADRLSVTKLAGCALGFAGVLITNRGGGLGLDTLLGDVMILLSTLCSAAGNILSKKLASNRDPVKITAFQLLTGGAVLTAAGLALGGRLSFEKAESTLILLWLAFVSAAAFSVWTALLKYHPASRITIFNLLVPIFGTMLSGVLLGEDVFGLETLISLCLITLGIAFVNVSKKESPPDN